MGKQDTNYTGDKCCGTVGSVLMTSVLPSQSKATINIGVVFAGRSLNNSRGKPALLSLLPRHGALHKLWFIDSSLAVACVGCLSGALGFLEETTCMKEELENCTVVQCEWLIQIQQGPPFILEKNREPKSLCD